MSATMSMIHASMVTVRRSSASPSTHIVRRTAHSHKKLHALSTSKLHRAHTMQSRRGVIMAAKKADQEEEEDDEEEYEEVEEEVEETIVEEVPENKISIQTVQEVAPQLWAKPVVRNGIMTVGAVLGATLLFSCWKVFQKWRTPKAKRKRTVGANKYLVETLSEYLPAQRSGVTKGFVNKLSFETGFKRDLIFRKYLRYMLDQRPFDADAVADLLHLKDVCNLTDDQVMEVMEESAKRTFERTGILMRKPEGFTASGLQKKATGRATFAKLMYLADLVEFVSAEKGKELQMKFMEIFGATSDDFEELRITTLSEADTDALEKLMGRGEGGEPMPPDVDEDDEEGGEEAKPAQPTPA